MAEIFRSLLYVQGGNEKHWRFHDTRNTGKVQGKSNTDGFRIRRLKDAQSMKNTGEFRMQGTQEGSKA